MPNYDKFNSPSRPAIVSDSFTRPADTTAYAAGDAIADSASAPTVNEIAKCARKTGGGGLIESVILIDSANVATALEAELWIFDKTVTPDNDNAAFTPTDAEAETVVAIIPLTTSYVGDATAGAGGNRVYLPAAVNKKFKCQANSRSLFWALVARNAYVPVSAEKFTVKLNLLQD